jgi:hypothetical protein
MPLVDATLTATPNAAILFYADFQDLPLRGAFAPCPIHVPTGLTDSDSDCAGFTFDVIDSKVMQVGAVGHDDGGTDTLGFTLQADPADTALMSAIENPAIYVGRRVRVWLAVYNPATVTSGGATVTELRPLYRGYMTQPTQDADASNYIITMAAENYLALLSGAQNRTYVQSTLYDAGDTSGAVRMSGTTPGMPGGGGNFPQWDAKERDL